MATINVTTGTGSATVTVSTGARGPAGRGVPTGGTTGQVLKKASGTDYDADWEDESGGGGDVAGDTVAATAKTTPVDADLVPLVDSAASNVLKKLSWQNIKATLKTYFDSLYQATGAVSDTAYDATSWNGVTTIAPSKNAVRDKFESITTFSLGLNIVQANTESYSSGEVNTSALISAAGGYINTSGGGNIDTQLGGSITTGLNGSIITNTDGYIQTGAGAYIVTGSGGYIETGANSFIDTTAGGSIVTGGDINTAAGGSITTGTGNLTGPNISGTILVGLDNLASLTDISAARTNLGVDLAGLQSLLGIQSKTGTSTGLSAVGTTDITGLTGFTLDASTWYKLELHYLWTSTSTNFQINFVTTGTFERGGTTPALGQAMSSVSALATAIFVSNTTFQMRGSVGENRTNVPMVGWAYFKTGTSGTGKVQLELLAGTTLSTITSSKAVLTKM